MSRNRISRNDPCPCGSGKKYKHCCYGQRLQDEFAATSDYKSKFPIGTVARYGPDDKRTTKIAAGVILHEGAEPIMRRWVSTDVETNPKVRTEMKAFFLEHKVANVIMSDGIMGCPHEEGEDFPDGEDCPFCPFWKGKQGTARRD